MVPRIFRSSNGQAAETRSELRKMVRLAAKGDAAAFTSLAENYLDLAVEYLFFSGFSDSESLTNEVLATFSTVWERIGFAARLSDLERLLTLSLRYRSFESESGEATPDQRLIERIRTLPAAHRFLLIAVELEHWSPHWTGLASRTNRKDFERHLLTIRCRICGLSLDHMDPSAQECFARISHDLSNGLTLKKRAKLCRRLEQFPSIQDFRSEWLSLRCELIELRQQIRWAPEERTEFSRALSSRIAPDQLMHPDWADRVKNWVRFESFPDAGPS